MACGESGQVIQVDGSLDVVHRLAEMGLREQVDIRMVQPGCPCIIALNGHRLSLRVDDDVEIFVALNQS